MHRRDCRKEKEKDKNRKEIFIFGRVIEIYNYNYTYDMYYGNPRNEKKNEMKCTFTMYITHTTHPDKVMAMQTFEK